jgi:hypothetical protein
MRYKTTIHIIADARDRNEAVEMADEYLAGHLSSGIDMRCSTKPAYHGTVKVASAVAVSALVLLAVLVAPQVRHATGMSTAADSSAIQPPLKTSNADKISVEFKKEWQVRQTAEALNAIR